jgi:TPR repeat protein
LASILAFAAIAPWVAQALQLTRYPYERAGVTETLVYLALSTFSAWGYSRYGPTTAHRVPVGYRLRTVVALVALGNAGLFLGLMARDKAAETDTDDCHKAYWDWNDTAASKRCERAAKSGDADAQFGYGLILWSGSPSGVDQHAALEWLRRSAEQGHWLAQESLGGMLQMPELESTLQNRAEAFAWLVTAGDSKGAARLRAKLSSGESQDADRLAAEFAAKYPSKRVSAIGKKG